MIENCLRHKIIRDFLKHYTENRWKDLIPSLIEIGILNLIKSFNKFFFTNEELKKVLCHLQISQIEKDKERNKDKENKDIDINLNTNRSNEKRLLTKNNSKEEEIEREEKSHKLRKSRSKQNEKEKYNLNGGPNSINTVININNNTIKRMKMMDNALYYNNQDKQEKIKYCIDSINEMRNNIKNNYQFFKNNISIDFKNKISKHKAECYKKIENKNKNIQKKRIDKISYAISYDKDLRPSSISRKINKNHNNINLKTENDIIKYNHNYSSEKKSNKKSKNNSKTKSKNKNNKNKEKLLNLNLNNLNRINNSQNIKRKHYNFGKSNNKMEINHTSGNEKHNMYKKIEIIQRNIINSDMNNNYQVVKIGRSQLQKIKNTKQYIDNNNNKVISNSCNNNYRNANFINTLYQKVNMNEQAIKKNNDNYFSNREELNDFIRQNRIKFNIKNDFRQNLTKSERPLDRKNNFLKIDDKDKSNNKKNSENKIDKNKSVTKINNKEDKEIEIKKELLQSYPNSNIDYIKFTKSKTPKKDTINSENESISISYKNKIIDDTNKINDISIKDMSNKINLGKKSHNNISSGLKSIKLMDLKEINIEKKKNNGCLSNFEKLNGKSGNRYINVFGCEGEDLSLKDYSGIIDSSTSNEVQITQDFIFKESPINVFKGNKSNEHSINSNRNNNES